jgi:hypothetical protein
MKKHWMILLATTVIFSPFIDVEARGGARVGAGGGRVGVNRGIDRTPGFGRPSTVAGAAATAGYRAGAYRGAAYGAAASGGSYYYPSQPYYYCDPNTQQCTY